MTEANQTRAVELLQAALDLLRKCDEGPYEDALSQTVFYDDAECDGGCLMEDIENLLERIKK